MQVEWSIPHALLGCELIILLSDYVNTKRKVHSARGVVLECITTKDEISIYDLLHEKNSCWVDTIVKALIPTLCGYL